MFYRDPKCVYVADSIPKAQMIAVWLEGLDIPAEAMNLHTLGGFEGLTGIAPGVSHRGIEVWVIHPEHAEKALHLLAEHAEELAAERKASTGKVTAECEECGKSTEFPAAERGTVQTCPHCHKWVDVPAPDDDWDVGEEEEPVE
jgi:hypothetical protein